MLKITFVYVWYLLFEEYKGGQGLDPVFLGFIEVGNLHERYVMLIAVIIDVLQFTKDLLALLLILVICEKDNENKIHDARNGCFV